MDTTRKQEIESLKAEIDGIKEMIQKLEVRIKILETKDPDKIAGLISG